MFDFGADALVAVDLGNSVVEPYALAGIGFIHWSLDNGTESGSNTNFEVNLGGGAKFLTAGRIQPFVELRVSVSGELDPLLLGGGVLFTF